MTPRNGIERQGVAVRERSALEMIADCFRYQHPEAFGRAPVTAPILPMDLRYGRDESVGSAPIEFSAEEAMGHPGAVVLDRQVIVPGPATGWAA